jgi:hypothetical protein
MREQVRVATVHAEGASLVLLGLVEEDVVREPGAGPVGVLGVEAQDVDGGVGVAGGEGLGLASQVAPGATGEVAQGLSRDLAATVSAREFRVETGGQGAEDLGVASGFRLFEDLLEAAPGPPPQGDGLDDAQEAVALEGAVRLPELEQQGVQPHAFGKRDLRPRGFELAHAVHPLVVSLLRLLLGEVPAGDVGDEVVEGRGAFPNRFARPFVLGGQRRD